MGGGFGSKFGADVWGRTAAELAKKAGGRPVKMFLDRVQEHLAAGNRPSAAGKIKLGATKDGKLVAMIAETHGTGGVGGGADMFPLPYVYDVPASRADPQSRSSSTAAAPGPCGHPAIPRAAPSTEAAMDDLADKLGIDPLEFRLKNLAARRLPHADLRGRGQDGSRADRLAREAQAPRPERQRARSATAWAWPCTSGAAAAPRTRRSRCTINPDGSVELKTRDPGHRHRRPDDPGDHRRRGPGPQADRHHLEHRQLDLPAGPGLGRLDHDPVDGPAVPRRGHQGPRRACSRRSPRPSRPPPSDLALKDGQLWVEGEPIMALEGRLPQAGHGLDLRDRHVPAEGLSSVGVGGCQFAEVTVDIETGMVKVKKIVAIQDSGLIIDKLTWESQVYGGVIGGLNYGLFEERIMDPDHRRDAQPRHGVLQAGRAPRTFPRSSSGPTSPRIRRPAA